MIHVRPSLRLRYFYYFMDVKKLKKFKTFLMHLEKKTTPMDINDNVYNEI